MGEKGEGRRCPSCGGELWPRARYCHRCGAPAPSLKGAPRRLLGSLLVLAPLLGTIPLLPPRSSSALPLSSPGILHLPQGEETVAGVASSGQATPAGNHVPRDNQTSSEWVDSTRQAEFQPWEWVHPARRAESQDASNWVSHANPVRRVDGEITEVQVPPSAEEGEEVRVEVCVRNTGNIGECFEVRLSHSSGTVSGRVELQEGERGTVALSFPVTRRDGEIYVALYAGGALLDSRRVTLRVLYTDGEISGVGLPPSVEEFQPIEATVRVKNTGTKGATFLVRGTYGSESHSEEIRLPAGTEGSVVLRFTALRGVEGLAFSLAWEGGLLDEERGSVEVRYPELSLTSIREKEHSWIRDENSLPLAVVTLEYEVKNVGTGPAREVTLLLGGRSDRIPPIGAGETYRGSVSLRTSQVWEEVDGYTFLTRFEARGELILRYNGREVRRGFSLSIPREEIPQTFYLTPGDPVVREKLSDLLRRKAWYDLREEEVYLWDWVGGGIGYGKPGRTTGFGEAGGKRLGELCERWYHAHGFWEQLPRETIWSGKGVCVDKAILLATFLRILGYSPEDVYVVGGKCWGDSHAWVALHKSYPLVGKQWILMESTAGGASRVLFELLKPFSLLYDAIQTALGNEGSQIYRELYIYNDVEERRVRGEWRF